jgi:Protein of unknown function DUF262
MRTASTNKKVRELITLIRDGKLIPKPEFQRRLVWKIDDKNHFLDSVIRGFPFPEIYVADGDVNLDTGQGTQLLVDGLQRVTTLVQYFTGNEELKVTTVPLYRSLTDEQKTDFLQYDVSVRDLGAITKDQIVEVFRRINSTSYSLTDIEISNAVYRGTFKEFAERLSIDDFFTSRNVFTSLDYRRMGDLRFAVLLTATILGGYFNRDDLFEEFLDRYNDEFPAEGEIRTNFQKVFDFMSECGFDPKSRIWRKADLFTALVEIYELLCQMAMPLQPLQVVEALNQFYGQVDIGSLDQNRPANIYYKAALQASNDRVNRVRRGIIFNGVVLGVPDQGIMDRLRQQGVN